MKKLLAKWLGITALQVELAVLTAEVATLEMRINSPGSPGYKPNP